MNDSVLTIRNFDKLQHFKKKRPPWIKFYRDLPLDYPFINLPEYAKLTFVFLTIVASEHDNRIPYDIEFLSKRLAITGDTIKLGVGELLNAGMVSVSRKPGRKPKAIKGVVSDDTNDLPEGEGERETYTKEKRESQSAEKLIL